MEVGCKEKTRNVTVSSVRQVISTSGGHFPDRSLYFLSVWHQFASLFWHLPQTNKQTNTLNYCNMKLYDRRK